MSGPCAEATNLQITASGKRMFFPMGRHLGSTIMGFIIGAIFAGAGWFLVVQEGHTIFGSIFGGVGALIAIACIYAMANSLEVLQSGHEVQTVRRLFGLPVSRKSMHIDAFDRFKKDSSFKTQSGNKHVIYYSVEAIDRQGNRIVVGEGFKGANEADAAIKLIGAEFGLTEAANDPDGSNDSEYGTNVLA